MNWNLPNILSVLRVLAAPCVALAFVAFDRPLADQVAVAVFVLAALTDYLDGWLARVLRQESAFGKMLDPIADKAMVMIALVIIVHLYRMHWPILVPAVVIVLREVLISGLREFLGEVKLEVTKLAKWKTTLQMIAVCLLLIQGTLILPEDGPRIPTMVKKAMTFGAVASSSLGIVLLWIAAWFTLVTGWDYFRKGLPYIRQRDRVRARAPRPGEGPAPH